MPDSRFRLTSTIGGLFLVLGAITTQAGGAPPATQGNQLDRIEAGLEEIVEEFTTADHLVVLAVTAVLVPLVVGVHYEAMRVMVHLMARMRGLHRLIIVGVILGLVLAHLVEILMFALTYAILEGIGGFGTIHGHTGFGPPASSQGGVDYIYFSSIVYSTVGFGDLVPTGPLRLLAGIEALLGLMLVAWSASFTYLQMHEHWREAFEDAHARRTRAGKPQA